MDTNKIREALELAVVACSSPSAKEQYEAAYDACQSALSELDKAPKVLDAEEIKRIVETFAIEEVSQHGTQLVGMNDRQKEVCSLVLYHVSKVGYLAPAAGLTVEEVERANNVKDQCIATAWDGLSGKILVDGGSGTMRELLCDAHDVIRYLLNKR